MDPLEPNTPVIVGVGFCQEKLDDPTASSEACQLMVNAVRSAAEDALGANAARSSELLSQIQSISVPQGLWQYRNPGKLIADSLGCPTARSVVADLGVLQLTLLSDLCQAIHAGELELGVITGGEAKFRDLRSQITQQPIAETKQPEDTPPPDARLSSSDPFCSDLEAERGLQSPVEFFSIIESALRYEDGSTLEKHRDDVARLYHDFSEIAAANPHAWRRDPVPVEEIRNPTAKNPMLAFPYTKRHCSQWNVNQAVAVLVCSAGKAKRLGLDSGGWIYPLAAAQSKHVVPLAQQRQLHSHPGTVLSGERALALAGISAKDVTAAELYSCFPSAVRSFARDLRLEGVRVPTVTGAMAFAGGPFNHASLDGVARMVEVLRNGEPGHKRIGLVANLSGIFGKQGCALLSNVPNEGGYRYEDVTAAVAETDKPLPLNGDYAGPATVVGYTVVFGKGRPTHAIAFCDTPAGERTVVRTEDQALLESMTKEEFCGRVVEALGDGRFSSAA